MILIPNFTKKHAAALVLGVAAVTTSVVAVKNNNEARTFFTPGTNSPSEVIAPGVTISEYMAQAKEACGGFFVGDVAALSTVIDRLSALTIPQQAMSTHFDLVSILTIYRQQLVAGNQMAAEESLNRLKTFIKENNWIGIAI